MAAFSYDDYRASDEGGTFAAILNWGGAFLSIVLIAGLATWGWKLWVRDVAGVPVVRALEGPMRVSPEDPGGLASEYQGLTVNRIAEERVEAAPSQQVILAPAPATLDEGEDLAMAELPGVAPEAAPVAGESIEGADAFATVDVAPAPAIGEPESFTVADIDPDAVLPLAEIDAETGEQATALIPEITQPSATDLAVAAALGLKPEPAVMKVEAAANVPLVTPRPQIRPQNLQRVSLAPQSTAIAGEVDPASIAPGTRLVQLGAYASADVARIEWTNTEARFADFMVGKQRVVQQAQTGGRQFYRLRVMGFEDLSDARRFCAVLVTDGANCIPVVHE